MQRWGEVAGPRFSSRVLSLLMLLTAQWLVAAPKVESVFPTTRVLLGQSVDWRIAVRHAYWETYRLKLKSCAGAEMQLVQENISELKGELQTTFVVRIVPVSLNMPYAPLALLTDAYGHQTLLAGRQIQVRAISGGSSEIKDPEVPQFPSKTQSRRLTLLFAATGLVLAGMMGWALYLRKSPRQTLRRKLTQTLRAIRASGVPESAPLLHLLRSSLLWGFDAMPLSVAELQERAQANPNLKTIATAMVRLEEDRYAGAARKPGRAAAEASLAAALAMVDGL
jgi:hypothetical protein